MCPLSLCSVSELISTSLPRLIGLIGGCLYSPCCCNFARSWTGALTASTSFSSDHIQGERPGPHKACILHLAKEHTNHLPSGFISSQATLVCEFFCASQACQKLMLSDFIFHMDNYLSKHFLWKNISFPPACHKLSFYMWLVCFRILYSIPLVYLPVLLLMLCCLNSVPLEQFLEFATATPPHLLPHSGKPNNKHRRSDDKCRCVQVSKLFLAVCSSI